jgi:sugar phosphate isomerase/epimerase
MYPSLNPGALGIQVGFEDGLALAARHGFNGYHFNLRDAANLGVERVRELADTHGVKLTAWGFPVMFRADESSYRQSLAELPELARIAAALGAPKTSTAVMPNSDELSYRHNFDLHVSRLKPVTEILAAHGIRLGLEYVGPKTLWSSGRFPFIHTLVEVLELCSALGPNVGVLLDSFHWYTAQETVDDLRGLTAEQIVDVHVNDAPDVPTDEQQDLVRELPGTTGVIDIGSFLGAVRASGYDDSVMVEPFSRRLRDLPPDEACAETMSALKNVLLAT